MKAKLIKDKDGSFHLSHVPSGWWIGDTDHEKVKQHKGEQILSKLSLKNCQAIELGYDLDELIDKYCRGNSKIEDDFIKEGFQKILEILGDKKFSEDDMKEAYSRGFLQQGIKSFNSLIQSLQQTEWEVEIVEQCLDSTCDVVNKKGECITTGKPLLDTEGNLILKRKQYGKDTNSRRAH